MYIARTKSGGMILSSLQSYIVWRAKGSGG